MKNPDDVEAILQNLYDVMKNKHEDYGPMNGLRVRMYDKLARLVHLSDKSDTPNYESIEDTLIDLANYAIIGLLVQRGQWEGINYEEDCSIK